MKTKLYFRVNGLKNSGLGHLTRCMAFAQLVENDFDICFLVKVDADEYLDLLSNKGFKVVSMPSSLGYLEDAHWVCDHYLQGNEILILDGYDFLTDYQRIVKKAAGKLVCIDDICHTHFVADAVINPGGGVQREDYDCDPSCKLFVGLNYLLLRLPFWKNNSIIKRQGVIGKVLICMGGEDPNNETLRVLRKCEQVEGVQSCNIVIGSAYRHKEKLDDFCKKTNLKINIFSNLSASEMIRLMQHCDSAICPPSTIALEYLTVGGNLFLHLIAENQLSNYKFLINQQLAFPLKDMAHIDSSTMVQALLRQEQLIDKKSPQYLRQILLDLEKEFSCNFREANMFDIYQYFEWTNDPGSREQSFCTDPVPFMEHRKWFLSKINADTSKLYIMEYNGIPAGQIRFDVNDHIALISYSLDKAFRGNGLAAILLSRGLEMVKKDMPQIRSFEGYVKPQNIPSIRIFQKLNFEQKSISAMKILFTRTNTTYALVEKQEAATRI